MFSALGLIVGEWRDVVDAAVVERLRQRFQLSFRAHEIDGDGVAVDASAARGEVRLDLVGVAVQRLGDAAVLAEVVRRFEPRLDADGEA